MTPVYLSGFSPTSLSILSNFCSPSAALNAQLPLGVPWAHRFNMSQTELNSFSTICNHVLPFGFPTLEERTIRTSIAQIRIQLILHPFFFFASPPQAILLIFFS